MGSYKTGADSEIGDFEIQVKPFFDPMFSAVKYENLHVTETLEHAGVKIVGVDAGLGIQTAHSVIQTSVNPFFPRAGIPLI
jgi:hypothetical protein